MGVKSTGVRQRIPWRPLPDTPKPGSPHQWVVVASWKISDEVARKQATGSNDEIHLDHENILAIDGPGCWICEEPWSPEIADRPCPGDPNVKTT